MRLLPLSIALGLSLAALPALAQRGRSPSPPPAPTACTDFHAFTNRAWLQANPASAAQPERSRLGLLASEAQQRQQALFDAAQRAPATPEEALLGAFWAAGLDEAALDRNGPEALRNALAPLSQFRRPRDLPQVAAAFHRKGLFPLAEFVRLEEAGSSARPLAAVPAPLGLVDPAFYLSTEAEARSLLGQYRRYVEAVLRASGLPEAEVGPATEAVLQIETQLAQALAGEGPDARSSDSLRAQDRRYVALGFAALMKALNASTDTLVVVNPAYFATLSRLAGERDPQRLRWYLRYRVLHRLAPDLHAPFRNAHGAFFASALRGLPTAPAREEHLATLLRRNLGSLNDAAYIGRYAPSPLRERASRVAEGVRAAAIEMVTKAGSPGEARKLEAIRFDIAGSATPGFDGEGLEFSRDDHVGNLLRLSRWQEARVLANRPTPVDPLPARLPAMQWLPAQGLLAVSAAALAPPLLAGNDASPGPRDFGAFGALVGHELAKHLEAGSRGAGLGPLYNGFMATPVLRVDGNRTLPMNRADLAGLEFAWAAFQKAQPQADAEAKKAFFTAWAELWAKSQTPEALAAEVQGSPYAPAAFRVNGPLAQFPPFAEAFGCRPGQPMRAANPIGVWR